jgi:hypothetical protein
MARDSKSQRDVCAADGHKATAADRLGVAEGGYRVHQSHFKDPKSGLFGKQKK